MTAQRGPAVATPATTQPGLKMSEAHTTGQGADKGGRPWLGGLLALGLLIAMLLPGLGASGLLDPWEMDRAAVARRVAAAPRVAVIDRDGALLTRLDEALGHTYALQGMGGSGPGSARAALQRASSQLSQDITHAAVIDLEAVIDGRRGAAMDAVASQIDALEAENRGLAIIAVAPQAAQEALREELAEARARLHARRMGGGWWQHGQATEKSAAALAALFRDDHVWSTSEALAETVRAHCPSPWSRVQHKVDGHAVQAPWLDTVLVAASLSAFGPSETAARLPGALIALLTGLLLFAAVRRLWDDTTAWLALVVFASLPLTLGAARVVTLEHTGALGLALAVFGLALGAQARSRSWPLWYGLGLLVLLLGQGLAGLAVGVLVAATWALVQGERRLAPWAAAGVGLGALALAAWVVLGNEDSALLRSFRFTWVPFRGGVPADRSDFSWIIGQLGFSLYPWGPLFLLGAGRLIFAERAEGAVPEIDQDRAPDAGARLVLALGLAVPLLAWMVMLPDFHRPVVPLAPVVAVTTGLLLRDVLRGRVSGGVVALLIIVPAILVHREIGKQASVMVRWLAFDPPFGGERPVHIWPGELGLNRALRAVVLLAVVGFALGLGRPVATAREALARVQGGRAAAWALGSVAIAWALDAVISLGTRLDVLLRANAARTGYHYDRVWTTIQGTRPEVVAGATLFAVLLGTAAWISLGGSRGWGHHWLPRKAARVAGLFGSTGVALGAIGAAAIGVLVSGLMVGADVGDAGWGQAAGAGLGAAAFWIPAGLAGLVGGLWAMSRREALASRWIHPERPGLLSGLLATVTATPALAMGAPALVALAGLGIGASQAAGTWSYGFLAACWALATAVGLVVAGRCGADLRGYAAALLGVAATVWGSIFAVLAARFLADGDEGLRYLRHILLTAPDAGLLWGLLGLLWLNRLALHRPLLATAREGALWAASLIERPRWGVGLVVLAGVLLSAGYAHTLLPGLSLHFSQKHILNRVAEEGGADVDPQGLPRTFKYIAGGRGAVHSNFYTQNMPTISDRRALIDLLTGRNVATRVTDWGESGRSANLALAGWSDANDADGDGLRDAPAFFGIVAKADGVQLQAEPAVGGEGPQWKEDSWKGAVVHSPGNGGPVQVVANSADTLTLARPTSLVAGDLTRGAFAVDALQRDGAHADASAMRPLARFAVLPKTSFSEINHAFRRANEGRHIPVLDARSSQLVLATSRLSAGRKDENWLRDAVLDDKALDAIADVHRISVDFDGKLELIGWRLASASVARSQKYELEIFFRVHEPVNRSYQLFMHPHPLHRDLWPHDWHTGGEADAKRCTGCFQTDHWVKGDIVRWPIVQEVPLGTSSGSEDIILGLWDPLTEKRLAIKAASGAGVVKHADNRVTIARLQVR